MELNAGRQNSRPTLLLFEHLLLNFARGRRSILGVVQDARHAKLPTLRQWPVVHYSHASRYLAKTDVETLFIDLGSLSANGYVESVNSLFRDELLNMEESGDLVEALCEVSNPSLRTREPGHVMGVVDKQINVEQLLLAVAPDSESRGG